MGVNTGEAAERTSQELIEIVQRYRDPIRRYSLTVCPTAADAEDATQASFVALLESVQLSNRPRALRPWLLTVARNFCLRLLRAASRPSWVPQSAQEENAPEQLTQERAVMVSEAFRAIETLEAVPREVILRRDFLGQSSAVAASEMGLSLAGLKTHLHRSRKAVRDSVFK